MNISLPEALKSFVDQLASARGYSSSSLYVVSGAFLARALGSHASARDFARIANGVTRFGFDAGRHPLAW